MFRNTVKIGSSVRKYATTSGSVVSKLSNGIKVAAADLNKEGSMGSISIVVKAGSRFEDANSAGAAHFFKAFGFRDSEKRTSFRKVREAELQGANLSAQVTRENVIFTVECLKVDIPYYLEQLTEMVTRTLYNPWEFDAVKSTVQFESKLASSCATTLLTEKLHNVAFRSGLGNSLYAEFPSAITSSKQVKEYAASNLGTDTVSIVGTGIETAKLVELLSAGPLAKVSGASSAAATAKAATKFHPGSQAHITCNSGASQYILGFQTESAQAARVLAHHLGTGKNLKWMTSSGFPLINTSIKTGASVFAFPCVYSDASMLAVSVATSNDLIASTTKQVVDQLKATASSIDDVAASRAVANTKMAAYQAFESAGSLRSSLVEMVTSQNATSLADVASAYDSLNASSVSALASKTFNAKPVGVSLGNAQSVPYLDTLGF